MEIVYEKCGVKISPKEGDHRRYRRNFCSREKKVWKKIQASFSQLQKLRL